MPHTNNTSSHIRLGNTKPSSSKIQWNSSLTFRAKELQVLIGPEGIKPIIARLENVHGDGYCGYYAFALNLLMLKDEAKRKRSLATISNATLADDKAQGDLYQMVQGRLGTNNISPAQFSLTLSYLKGNPNLPPNFSRKILYVTLGCILQKFANIAFEKASTEMSKTDQKVHDELDSDLKAEKDISPTTINFIANSCGLEVSCYLNNSKKTNRLETFSHSAEAKLVEKNSTLPAADIHLFNDGGTHWMSLRPIDFHLSTNKAFQKIIPFAAEENFVLKISQDQNTIALTRPVQPTQSTFPAQHSNRAKILELLYKKENEKVNISSNSDGAEAQKAIVSMLKATTPKDKPIIIRADNVSAAQKLETALKKAGFTQAHVHATPSAPQLRFR